MASCDSASRIVGAVDGAAHRMCCAVIALLAWLAAFDSPAQQLRAQPYADQLLVRAIRRIAQPITGSAGDYDRLIAAIGDARIVMLGEDTHGTREHYLERARIT
jgi:erythromycin esterase-like protein